LKDFNDIIVAGLNISDIKCEPIDKYLVRQILLKYPDREQQYTQVEKFIKTIKNELLKSDISLMLSKEWEQKVDDIKKQFSVQTDSIDEKLEKFNSIFDCFNALDEASNEEELSIGYAKIDANITFRKKRVILLGAFSNSGKTENLIEWILHWVIRLKKNVLFFSLEMPREDILEIIIAKIIGMRQHEVRAFRKSPQGKGVYQQVAEKIQKYLYIVDENDLSINDIEEYIILANSRIFDKGEDDEKGVDIVCTDYYQYLAGISTIEDDKKTARSMKKIAKRHNVMFVMLSQFNKQSQRKGKDDIQEPTMVDLNGAGDIGFSADVILLLWRPIHFQKMSEIEYNQKMYQSRIKAAKARGGFKRGVTQYYLIYDPETSRLTEQ
jgi:replicative DNA helicase